MALYQLGRQVIIWINGGLHRQHQMASIGHIELYDVTTLDVIVQL